jgi:hypothetical protein
MEDNMTAQEQHNLYLRNYPMPVARAKQPEGLRAFGILILYNATMAAAIAFIWLKQRELI